MNKLSQAFDFQKFQQNPRLADVISDVESRYTEVALSDDDLELVSAAGETTVPTMEPEVLLGRHARPDNMEENKP